MKKRHAGNNVTQYISIMLILCIAYGVLLHIVPFFSGRSLWIDEAMLASSICTRSLKTLIASPLDFGQSAAPGWLYIVKLLTLLFGTSEYVLRSWSLFTSIAGIAVVYFLMSNRIRRNYALLFTALFSLTDGYIYFASEAKPYMSDNVCSLLILYLWQRYREKKISLIGLSILYSVLVWFSFTGIFFIAACMIIECIRIIRRMISDTKAGSGMADLCKCAMVLVSFAAYYILWLSKSASSAGGAGYWDLIRFPLIPGSLSDIRLVFRMSNEFLELLPSFTCYVLCILGAMYIVYACLRRKDRSGILAPSFLSLLLLLTASFLGFYPIQERLVSVYGMILIVIAGYMCGAMEDSAAAPVTGITEETDWRVLLIYVLLAVVLIDTGKDGSANLKRDHVQKPGSEVAESIDYLEKNAGDSDVIYVYRQSLPVYMYETGYETDHAELAGLARAGCMAGDADDQLKGLPYQKGNTVYGQKLIEYDYKVPYSYEGHVIGEAVAEDAGMVSGYDSVYLFTSHRAEGIAELIAELEKTGTVTVAVDSNETYLYHYVRER